MNFAADIEGVFSKAEIESFLKDEQQFYIKYAEENWLDRYFKIKAMSQKTQVPSITSVISDTPGGSNPNNSKTEQFALKSIQAREWLDTIFDAMESLAPAEQKLIELKYMKKRNDGSRYSDEVIYPQLFIGKTRYYELKKEALEMLGRKLYGLFSERGCS
ncbi:ArpU family phage packaging/lysis transcriptional regulator [Virgibacillus sp. 179-BFC.A HS]|uniref:ArpU family phage packaging/lysis transcriptional regulator n=1 Tax=Tigheibacillus jepli TaxID=3035914 RepID=A0ABU5CP27_9BACI|nr:ArpU family phage packaging/lysis transcriptional regulator [Virgibacillus sp. 179-BFC.A HS]MDY0407230.1 ArpU family phage packaging/lysis transcriptional regulator [Virgibacillus sp. 179-BFC.A HS]